MPIAGRGIIPFQSTARGDKAREKEQSMPAVTLRPTTWNELLALAERQQLKPDRLVERAVRDFLNRAADEELLATTRRQAQSNSASVPEIEEAIKKRRRAKR